MLGRVRAYSDAEIAKRRCSRCRGPAIHQWQACALGRWVPICAACDVELNRLALNFMRIPGRDELIARYEASLGA